MEPAVQPGFEPGALPSQPAVLPTTLPHPDLKSLYQSILKNSVLGIKGALYPHGLAPHRQADSRVSSRGYHLSKDPVEEAGPLLYLGPPHPRCPPPQATSRVRSLENPNPRHLKGVPLSLPHSNLVFRPGPGRTRTPTPRTSRVRREH